MSYSDDWSIRMRRSLTVLLALTIAAIASGYASAQAGAFQPDKQSTPREEKKICKVEEGTGSIIPRRTCHTKAEWDRITADSQQLLDRSEVERRGAADAVPR